MDVMNVPYLSFSDSIETALSRLQQTKSRAIVVSQKKHAYLFLGSEVAQAFKAGLVSCEQLDSKKERAVLDLIKHQNDLFKPGLAMTKSNTPLQKAIEFQLDKKKMDYGMLFYSQDSPNIHSVSLITRHEQFKDSILNGPVICICTGPSQHLSQGNRNIDGKKCGDCTYTYRCY